MLVWCSLLLLTTAINDEGVQVMATINLQCNSLSKVCTFKCFSHAENSMIGRAYVHGRNADTSLAEIH